MTSEGPSAAPPAPGWLKPPFGRRTLAILFIAANAILIAIPSVRALNGGGRHRDYQLWYFVGRQVLTGGPIYTPDATGRFAFLYPPFAAELLAPFALFGPALSALGLALVTAASWWLTARLSDRLSATPGPRPWWLIALPSVISLPFIWDMYDLGQPNLMLLAIMLAGLALMRAGRQGSAGVMFAAAAALKAFPLAIFPYLLWRRRWLAAASMAVFTAVFLVLAPAPVRGFERNLAEVKTWAQGMVFSASEKGFGQRPEQNWGWKNNSVIAVTHRLVRPVNAEAEDATAAPLYVNILDLTYDQANLVVLAVAGLIGLGFIVAMPSWKRRTTASDAAEFALLIALMTIASPLARAYYFVWLLFPFTLLAYRAVLDPEQRIRRVAGGGLALSLVFFALGFPVHGAHWGPALGTMLWATCAAIAALVWLMRHDMAPRGLGGG